MSAWLLSSLGFGGDEAAAPVTPSSLSPEALEAGLAVLEAALEPDTERLLRAGGEQGLAPAGSGIGRPTLERWLRAEKGNAASAAARLNAHAKWRAEYVSEGRVGCCPVASDAPTRRPCGRHAG